jgi:membrane protein implicated in regulation of membrane protease activity
VEWLWWLGAALAAGLIEMVTVDFVFIWFAGGALAAMVAGMVGAGVPVQVAVFAAVTAVLLVAGRPPLRAWARRTPHTPMNSRALIGRPAQVLQPVTASSGQVKISGQVWTARTAGPRALEVGSTVHVVRIDGATAVVGLDPDGPGPAIEGERG